ncbi:sensor histidine kinase [Actinoallomurus iriomotensis]|uniref:histidine kinase n=1 Tax=Actinoallomurus iriomotensis TaxID=478107 RepID=A0A9W6SFI7_9ACTN|nr:ATP-binding protein [Actinoallomurus iriomotensis]GLY91302.1 hypothetical protein Airi02_092310 [Actinoallomurus iriomotensis]
MIDFRRVPHLWRRWDVTVRDLPLALTFVGASFLPVFHGHETQVGELPARPVDALAVAALVLERLPVALHRLGGAERLDGFVAFFLALVLAWGLGSWLRSTRAAEAERRLLHTLVEQIRQAGQPVEFTEEGRPAESAGSAEFVAYRVVQEALTNTLKYAHGSRTSVHARYHEKEITMEVGTDGSGSRSGSPGGSGRGLAGLRERVDALGGEFSADRQANGGFVARARIPAGSPS